MIDQDSALKLLPNHGAVYAFSPFFLSPDAQLVWTGPRKALRLDQVASGQRRPQRDLIGSFPSCHICGRVFG